jgi:exosome complex RNA-binding protein Rrp42 (RNase PH superfamily)
MRLLSVFAVAFLLPGLLSAQKLSKDFDVTVSEPFKVVDAPSKEYFAVGDGMTISVKTRGEVVTIQKFDTESMKEVSRKEYKDFPRYNKVQAILQRKDKLL